jgi:hypothetical protein
MMMSAIYFNSSLLAVIGVIVVAELAKSIAFPFRLESGVSGSLVPSPVLVVDLLSVDVDPLLVLFVAHTW